MKNGNVSAIELRDYLRAAGLQSLRSGRRLNEGANRVLHKLETVTIAEGLHRIYVKTGKTVKMWDLLSDDELSRGGYLQTRERAYAVFGGDAVRSDRITCWMSEAAADELWVGEALSA